MTQLLAQKRPSRTKLSTPVSQKKILILSSKGGYGHTAATNAITEILKVEYRFAIENPIDEIHKFGLRSGENFYNHLIKNEWIRTMNFLSEYIAPWVYKARTKYIEKLIDDYIEKEKPDIVLSVIPYLNYPASEAARKRNIPFLLVTIDNDLRNWVLDLGKIKHPSFKVTIGKDLASSRGLLLKEGVKKDRIHTIGLPIHPSFFVAIDKEEMKKRYKIPPHKPTILVMTGGAGGIRAYDFAEKIISMEVLAHVLVCAGNNHTLYEKLHHLKPQHPTSLMALSFTNKIAELMSIADLIITKAGPGSINEAMTKKLPILVDNTNSCLVWERVNKEIITNEKIGDRIDKVDDLETLIPKYMHDRSLKEEIKQKYAKIALPAFEDNFVNIVREMIHTAK